MKNYIISSYPQYRVYCLMSKEMGHYLALEHKLLWRGTNIARMQRQVRSDESNLIFQQLDPNTGRWSKCDDPRLKATEATKETAIQRLVWWIVEFRERNYPALVAFGQIN